MLSVKSAFVQNPAEESFSFTILNRFDGFRFRTPSPAEREEEPLRTTLGKIQNEKKKKDRRRSGGVSCQPAAVKEISADKAAGAAAAAVPPAGRQLHIKIRPWKQQCRELLCNASCDKSDWLNFLLLLFTTIANVTWYFNFALRKQKCSSSHRNQWGAGHSLLQLMEQRTEQLTEQRTEQLTEAVP